ncbi:glycosyltransferase family 39 protein [Cohnella silvisoli]|uniref:Glycosyltransferase family 39 protein n=1 Tax=Cohnella silvisoli TaxID=2873699 RepID=A0ABV1KYH8_9BACL|nr:glycosyltransferase family 39 protein [Cohnella silvisoli]MCD9024485.1 glycosyltransferase family 39 protein [Cohnella silvisoli]
MWKKQNRLPWALFFFFFISEFSLGYYISHVIGYLHSDAISRVANAFYVLYSRDPHLGAIGFIWNPLPSLLELIPLLFYPLYPPLASSALAGILLTSMFAGLTAIHLYRAGQKFKLSIPMSVTVTLLYGLNPFIFLFGANGLSDVPYMYFLMMSITEFCFWMKDRKISSLLVSGFTLSLAFWTRYEAVPFGFSIALSIVIVVFLWQRDNSYTTKEKWYKVEATSILVLLPVVFSGFMWLFFNYSIMGNPLYFLNSEYSNDAAAVVLRNDAEFQKIFKNPWTILQLVIKKTFWYSIPLFSILIVRIITGRLFKWDIAVLLLLFCAVPGLQYLLLLRQTSFGWFRYFMYVLPVVVAWIPYELGMIEKRMRRISFAIISCGLFVTACMLSYALTNPNIAPDEHSFLTIKKGNESYQRQLIEKDAAKWMDDNITGTILTDSASAFTILVNSRVPKKYLITSDLDFRASVDKPLEHNVDYILIPKPLNNVQSTINMSYPDMYENGDAWVKLERDFGGLWRLYKVIQD